VRSQYGVNQAREALLEQITLKQVEAVLALSSGR
jgi:hypothetical protein